MKQRHKRISEAAQGAQATQALTTEEQQFLEAIKSSPEMVCKNKGIFTVNATDQETALAASIIQKLLPGVDPYKKHINVVLEKYDEEL